MTSADLEPVFGADSHPEAAAALQARARFAHGMVDWWDYWMDGYDAPQGGSGMATTLPVEPERDLVAELHAAVADVTGKPVEVQPKPRMGFL